MAEEKSVETNKPISKNLKVRLVSSTKDENGKNKFSTLRLETLMRLISEGKESAETLKNFIGLEFYTADGSVVSLDDSFNFASLTSALPNLSRVTFNNVNGTLPDGAFANNKSLQRITLNNSSANGIIYSNNSFNGDVTSRTANVVYQTDNAGINGVGQVKGIDLVPVTETSASSNGREQPIQRAPQSRTATPNSAPTGGSNGPVAGGAPVGGTGSMNPISGESNSSDKKPYSKPRAEFVAIPTPIDTENQEDKKRKPKKVQPKDNAEINKSVKKTLESCKERIKTPKNIFARIGKFITRHPLLTAGIVVASVFGLGAVAGLGAAAITAVTGNLVTAGISQVVFGLLGPTLAASAGVMAVGGIGEALSRFTNHGRLRSMEEKFARQTKGFDKQLSKAQTLAKKWELLNTQAKETASNKDYKKLQKKIDKTRDKLDNTIQNKMAKSNEKLNDTQSRIKKAETKIGVTHAQNGSIQDVKDAEKILADAKASGNKQDIENAKAHLATIKSENATAVALIDASKKKSNDGKNLDSAFGAENQARKEIMAGIMKVAEKDSRKTKVEDYAKVLDGERSIEITEKANGTHTSKIVDPSKSVAVETPEVTTPNISDDGMGR